MKIAVNGRFYAARPTGVQRVARQLVEELRRRTDLTLYLPRGCEPPERTRGGARVRRGTLRGIPWEQVELPLRAMWDRPDLSLDLANAGPSWGGCRILVLHDVFPITNPEWYGAAFRGWFRTRVVPAARRAERVVMFTNWAKGEAVRALGIPEHRISVVSQGTGPFEGPPRQAEVDTTLSRFGLRRGFLLAGGDGDARKNTSFLLDVARRLSDRGRPVPDLVLTGASYTHVHATERPSVEPVPVRRLGFVTDQELRALYAGAGLFCFPSLAEGFGRPPLEAMACGTPVLAADYGSATEVLGSAASILPLDAGRWADHIATVLGDGNGDARERRIAAGRARAATFSWENAAGQLLEVCRTAVAGRDAG